MPDAPYLHEHAASIADWGSLLDLVAAGQVRVTITSSTGRDAVMIAASDLAALQVSAARAEGCVHPVVLTPREREVLALVAVGDSALAVARRLGLSVSTVTAHLVTARRKYGVRSSAQAAARARAAGHLVGALGDDADGDAHGH